MTLATLRRHEPVGLADLPVLRLPTQRTAAVRVVLSLALAGTLAGLVLLARSAGTGRAAVFPQGTSTGVVVLDMSASISGPTYARVATTLKGIVDANQSIGLVMVSDTAYELLPPNSPPGALLEFIPFFVPLRFYGSTPVFGQTPWDTFMGGTRLSDGLATARRSLERAHVEHGAILIVSDLDDAAADKPQLDQEALILRQRHIPVRVVGLFPQVNDVRLFTALFGSHAMVDPKVFTHTATRREQSVAASQPWALLGVGLVLVLLLAANERWNARLEVRGAAA